MDAPSTRSPLPALLLALAAAMLVATAGWGDLYNETDGQYGGAAKIMSEGGSWLIPENNGIPRLAKPPLLYWGMALAMQGFGVNAFAARLPSALALSAWVLLTCLIGRQMGGPWRGFTSGLILLTSLGTFTLGRIVMPEPLFAMFIAGAIYCVLRGQSEPAGRTAWFTGFWLCASLASFTKGWHGLIYPAAVIGLAAVLCREGRPGLRGLLSWRGLLIFAAINLPWHLAVESRYPGYLHNLLFAEQLGHMTGSDAPATSYTDVPRLQFLLLHLAWFFPWSLAAGCALWQRRREAWETLRAMSWPAAVTASWIAVIGGSVMLTGERQDYYAMAMWPAFALTAAWLIEKASLRGAAVAAAVLLGAALVAAITLPGWVPARETAAVAARATAWTALCNFDQSVWMSLRTTAVWALGGGLLAALMAAAARNRRTATCALAASASCLGMGALAGTSLVSPYFSLAQAADQIPAGATIVYDGGIDTGSSLLVYTDAPVLLLNQDPDDDFIVRKFGIGRDRYVTTEQWVRLWQSAECPLIFVTEERDLPEWETKLGGLPPPAARCGTQVILRKPGT